MNPMTDEELAGVERKALEGCNLGCKCIAQAAVRLVAEVRHLRAELEAVRATALELKEDLG